MKVSRSCLSLFALLLLFTVIWSCESYEEKQAKEEKARKDARTKYETQRTQAITEFSKTHNADTTWQQSLKGKPLVTLELQNALIRPDGRPIVAAVHLIDVEKQGDEYLFRLHAMPADFSPIARVDLFLNLKCSSSLFPYNTLSVQREFISVVDPNYIVVARITNVKTSQYRTESDSISSVASEFSVSGECLGFKYIGDIGEERVSDISK